VADTEYELREGERWFVVQTQPFRENLAKLHLNSQNYRIFWPRFKKTVRHARKLRETIAPLFPGYIFVSLHVEKDRWRPINGTFGVARLLTAEGNPLPVPLGIVEGLISALDEAALVRLDCDLRTGQRVSVVAGPFAGGLGVLERLDGKGRVRILMSILGGPVSVAIDCAHLTAA
jgi:transcription elongation factor/antiterminator RfaH